jgi:hypothetical protein
MDVPDTGTPPASPFVRQPFPWSPQPFPQAGFENPLGGPSPGWRL